MHILKWAYSTLPDVFYSIKTINNQTVNKVKKPSISDPGFISLNSKFEFLKFLVEGYF